MKVLVEISDNDVAFGMKVLKSLSFIKRTKLITPADNELLSSLKDAAEQVRLHKQGVLKLKTAQELLDEL
ncbi:MAG: hypothetical protein M9958_08165 [Chitinophagales bacterium]|nr:hypothetical protein [Chitinophagales bacterium]